MDGRDNVWFLAPGLLHQLGNSLFAAQGRLALLDLGAGDAVPAAAEALGRALNSLQVLRFQLAGQPMPVGVSQLVHGVADVLRVPLRDLGLRLQVGEIAPGIVTDGSWLGPALLTGVRLLAGRAGHGVSAAITLVQAERAGRVGLQLGLHRDHGLLPFALDWTDLAAEVAAALPGRAGCVGGAHGLWFEVAVPAP